MTRSKEYTTDLRGLISPATVSTILLHLESTQDPVWISKTCKCTRHTIKGVPAKRIDVLIDDRRNTPAGMLWIVEIGTKVGRFDGAERPRLTLRLMYYKDAVQLVPVDLILTLSTKEVTLKCGSWTQRWHRLRWEPSTNETSLARIVTWHWQRWFQHLQWPDVRGLADSLLTESGESLAEANRRASRALYSLSRQLGWRKLTLRERLKLQLTGETQWIRDEIVLEAHTRLYGNPTGVSEYTLDISSGKPAGDT